MSFLKKDGGQKPAAADPDALAVEQLRKAGADPSMPHETRHFLYVPGVKAAQQVARALKRPDRRIEIETSARKGYWLVAVIQSVVVTPETIAALRTEFEAAVEPLGGEYDYWQVAVANG
ncbi:MAG: ribonuclease E inhibitor RraB [Candidatus Limnocylindrales bacterium]|jgi:hypothetical protein